MNSILSTAVIDRRRASDRAWLRVVRDRDEPAGVPAVIGRSWLRARDRLRIDPAIRQPARCLGAEALRERAAADDVLRLARPILGDFAARLGLSDHVLTLFDGEGWMLSIDGHERLVEAVSEIGFRPGTSWAEDSAGTNGPGTALVEARPVEVFGSEHYVEAWQPWTCAAAPVFVPGEAAPAAVVDLTGPWESHRPHALATVAAVSRALEERLRAALSVREEVVRHAFRAAQAAGDGLVAVDGRAAVIAVNDAAVRARIVEGGQLPLPVKEALRRAFAAPAPARGAEIAVDAWEARRCVVAPVLHDGTTIGAVIRVPARPVPGAARRPRHAPPPGRPRYDFARIRGESPALKRALDLARTASANALPVTLFGESGTGKELFARAIHDEGSRAGGPFVAVNCGAIPAELVESELFGYERGTFTGGRAEGKAGRFEDADGGTLFLDEVTDLSGPAQTALLRVLQEREVVRVGGSAPRPVDVRIVAASNRPLLREVQERRFRRDLFYRLSVLHIDIPSLRDRGEDLAALAEAILREIEAEIGRGPLGLAPAAREALARHSWPGNVRELRNVLLRAAATSSSPVIGACDLRFDEGPPSVDAARGRPAPAARSLRTALGEEERTILVAALDACGWNVVATAAHLGLSRMTLYRRLARHGLTRPTG